MQRVHFAAVCEEKKASKMFWMSSLLSRATLCSPNVTRALGRELYGTLNNGSLTSVTREFFCCIFAQIERVCEIELKFVFLNCQVVMDFDPKL